MRGRCHAGLLAVVGMVLLVPAFVGAATLPAGFREELVAGPLDFVATALDFTPDGRLLVATQSGRLQVVADGLLQPQPALVLSAVNSCGERGLLGVAVDPQFSSNHYVFLYYTHGSSQNCSGANRVSRFVLPASNVIDPASETVLIDNIPSPSNHAAGDLQFGKDGYLYVTVGDGACDYLGDSGCQGANDASRDRNTLLGKLLRIDRDGGSPPTNPFVGAGTARCYQGNVAPGLTCKETFAWGFRNPFRMAMDPNAVGVRLFVNDVGESAWEEIDEVQAGADYGWNCREGKHANPAAGATCNPLPPGLVDPIFEYAHGQQIPGTSSPTYCLSITGGAFVPDGLWPGFDGAYLFADYVCDGLFRLSPGSSWHASDLALGVLEVTALRFGPYGDQTALYYTTASREVRRLGYALDGAPTAMFVASPTWGTVPLLVSFDASASFDLDPGDTLLSYEWDFGDGQHLATSSSVVSHTYTAAGTRTVRLRVRDQHQVASAVFSSNVWPGNDPPQPLIVTPAEGQTFRIGDSIFLTGSASDPQDGPLPSSAQEWSASLRSGFQNTTVFGPHPGGSWNFSAPGPGSLAAAESGYLEVRLKATDLQGLSATAIREVQPHRVPLTFLTIPSALELKLNGTEGGLTPLSRTSWEAWYFQVEAPRQVSGTHTWVWRSWSNGESYATQNLRTPAEPTTYTATFGKLKPGVDLDDDGKAETIVYRDGAWLLHDYATGAYLPGASVFTGQPLPGCIPLPMDHDGDGRTDFTQWCAGAWHFYRTDGTYLKGIWTGTTGGDRPVPADYDGDGRDDVVLFRDGAWLFYDFASGSLDPVRSRFTGVVSPTQVPVPFDVSGDGAADFCVYANGAWFFYRPDGTRWKSIFTGNLAGSVPVPGDYDGDGKEDLVVFRNGAWLFWDFVTGDPLVSRNRFTGAPVHSGTPLPAPLDVDGNGALDFAVYSGGPWHFYRPDGSYDRGVWTGDVPGSRAVSRRLLP